MSIQLNPMEMPRPQQPQPTMSDIVDAPAAKCSKCGGFFFKEAVIIKELKDPYNIGSKLHTAIPIHICASCSTIAPYMLNDPNIKRVLDSLESNTPDDVEFEEVKTIITDISGNPDSKNPDPSIILNS